MEWFSVESCEATRRFGWLVGNASGLYGAIIVTLLILSAPSYRTDIKHAVDQKTRVVLQRLLNFAPFLLLPAWFYAYWYAQKFPVCFAATLCGGIVSVLAPLMLFLMFTVARWVGRSSAR